ncbi:MAG: hypothetical protein ACPGFB_06470 [Verrucomicrobiales bacterium]
MSERVDFFKAFLRSRGKVGAIAPGSMELAEIMVEWLDAIFKVLPPAFVYQCER